jgi:hypothetical protein
MKLSIPPGDAGADPIPSAAATLGDRNESVTQNPAIAFHLVNVEQEVHPGSARLRSNTFATARDRHSGKYCPLNLNTGAASAWTVLGHSHHYEIRRMIPGFRLCEKLHSGHPVFDASPVTCQEKRCCPVRPVPAPYRWPSRRAKWRGNRHRLA